VSRCLVGVVGCGAQLLQRTQAVRGALLPFESRWRPGLPELPLRSEGLAGMAELAPLFPGVGGGAKPLLFTTQPQEEGLSCARGQVVIARPPRADTPMTSLIGALL
jgi:hypothetical protein